jgi:dephospho-CoA kinase
MIIGITGFYCAGKGEATNFFTSKNFIPFSLSDVIREECIKENIELTRENLIKKANNLREEFGAEILAKKTVAKFQKDKNYVIDSIRNPEEIKTLKKEDNCTILFIQAPIETRFERLQKRIERKEDKLDFKTFKKNEEAEMQSSNPKAQQLKACSNLADFKIDNTSTMEEFHEKLQEVLNNVSKT